MIHRAIFGSLERFIGILLEHYAGNLPMWLAPVQVVIITIGEYAKDYAEELCAALTGSGIRSITDTNSETLNYKIRQHALAKIPVTMVLGKKEVEEKTVSIRYLGSNNQEILDFAGCIEAMKFRVQR